MASFTLNPDQRFPPGTLLRAYPINGGGTPTGSPVSTATVSNSSTTTFEGLTEDTRYGAGRTIAGPFAVFITPSAVTGGGGGASDAVDVSYVPGPPELVSTNVQDAIDESFDKLKAGQVAITANAKTADYEIALGDVGRVVEINSSSRLTVTIPSSSTTAFDPGAWIELYVRGAGGVTVAAAGGVTVEAPDGTLDFRARYTTVWLRQRATNVWVVSSAQQHGAFSVPSRFDMEVRADAPAVFWTLDDRTGTVAHDASGNLNHGTIAGGVSLDQPGFCGDLKRSMFFHGAPAGVQEYVALANVAALNKDYPSLMAVVNWDGSNGDIELGLISREDISLILHPTAGPKVRFEVKAPSADAVFSPAAITANTPLLVHGTYGTGGAMNLYVNGVQVATHTHSGADVLAGGGAARELRAADHVGARLHGALQKAAFFPYTLSAERVAAHARAMGV